MKKLTPKALSQVHGLDEEIQLTTSMEHAVKGYRDQLLGEIDISQLRTFCQDNQGNVTVKAIVRNQLGEKFREQKLTFEKKYGKNHQFAGASLGFHGTRVVHLSSIAENGLRVPDGNNVKHANDSGWWGKGIYVSPYPHYALDYAESGKVLVCAILRGKPYDCRERRDGGICEPGFDSHIAECGQEWVLFGSCDLCKTGLSI